VITIFVNGEAVASQSFSTNLDSTASLKLGYGGNLTDTPGCLDTGDFYLTGRIDQVELMTGTALSDADIRAIYDAPPSKFLFVPYEYEGDTASSIGITVGPDGNIYVTNAESNEVMRYHGPTTVYNGSPNLAEGAQYWGAPDPAPGQGGAVFVAAGSGGLQSPAFLSFGPDGNLYVVSSATNEVFRYNGQTGAFMDVFVKAANNGGLQQPIGLAFDARGNLYVGGAASNNIVRFDPNGNPSVFVPARTGGLTDPEGLAFGPDGNLYVWSSAQSDVLRYDGTTGAFLGTFASAASGEPGGPEGGYMPVTNVETFASSATGVPGYPSGLAFGPDGNLYVSSVSGHQAQVLRYEGPGGPQPGTFLGDYYGGSPSGESTTGIAFSPNGTLYISTGSGGIVLGLTPPPNFTTIKPSGGPSPTSSTSSPPPQTPGVNGSSEQITNVPAGADNGATGQTIEVAAGADNGATGQTIEVAPTAETGPSETTTGGPSPTSSTFSPPPQTPGVNGSPEQITNVPGGADNEAETEAGSGAGASSENPAPYPSGLDVLAGEGSGPGEGRVRRMVRCRRSLTYPSAWGMVCPIA